MEKKKSFINFHGFTYRRFNIVNSLFFLSTMVITLATLPALLPPRAEAVTYYRSSTYAPTVSYANLVDGQELTGTYKVGVKATDNKAVTYVRLYIDGTLFKKDSYAPYEFSIDTTRYPDGKHTLRAVAYDANNNFARAIITIYFKNTVLDTTAPSITAPPDITTEATAILTPVDLGSATVSDLVDSAPTIMNDAPPEGFRVGISTVTWSATDDAGNTATDTQAVTITDTKAPAVTAPPSIIQEAAGQLTSVNLGIPSASDIADPDLSISNDAPEGFPIGTTTVTWTVTDDSGNSATATQSVNITDTNAPSITVPSDITQEATGPLTLVSIGLASAIDMADPSPSITNDAPSDSFFPVGTTVITWTATDDSGNVATATQIVTIRDATKPEVRITLPVEDEVIRLAAIIVTGNASDNSGVASVEVSSQFPDSSAGTDFVSANTTDGYLHWSATIPVVNMNYTKIVARATDGSGNVDLHSVNIMYEQEQEPVPLPSPPPSNSTQDKILLATIIPWINLQTQMDIYKDIMNANDMAKVRADTTGALKANQVDAVLTLPGSQGAEFMAASHIEQNAEYLKSKGFEFIVYNLEAGISPEEDKADPVSAVSRAAAAAHSAGLDFHIAPTKAYTLSYGVEFARVSDLYHIQAQSLQAQNTPEDFSIYVHDIVSRFKSVNPDIITTVQVSTTRPAGEGLTLLETMQKCVDSVMDVSEGATTWFANDSVEIAREFYQWFSFNYNG